ncbi:threonine--tRNA ligase [Patescibacteria group bacterium]|nr:threonine--tRNA ligase [Patescibacteria group bacterium]MBU1868131.1 threonine--tRNA ligase [Patescibacteria group bacterium]
MSESNDHLHALRHTTEHVLTQAMYKLYPEIQAAMGPATKDGFYFDFDPGEHKIYETDFPKIEAEMQKIVDTDLPLNKEGVSIKEARQLFKDNPYKQEWLDDISQESDTATIYWTGSIPSDKSCPEPVEEASGKPVEPFVDLCAGPHIKSTGKIKAFKLLSIAGAYWRGDENNKMLTRIYGTAFDSRKKLKEYLELREEAKKRDHRKLGKQLDLFCFSELVGPGLPLYTPKGTIIIEELQKHIESVCRKYGFEKVITPHIAKAELYELSGHANKFNEELFQVSSPRGHQFVMKPVQCPHQTQIYASKTRSYRDLPLRYMESNHQYRAEKSGEVGGLNRVYAINVEDGHSFCRVDQVKAEVIGMVNIIKDFYNVLGLWGNHWVSLSVRDYDHPENYIGLPEDWDKCENMLEEVSKEMKLDAKKMEGEAALYGPKLDFMFKDTLGNEIQIPTVQVDFASPKRFGLFYIDENGEQIPPVMVHRAVLGSYERLLALLIEHFDGAFPPWLSPVQIKVIPISKEQNDYAKQIYQELKENNIRCETDSRDETMQAKIRNAQLEKVPYMLIVGNKETENNTVCVRLRSGENLGEQTLRELIGHVKKGIESKSLKL